MGRSLPFRGEVSRGSANPHAPGCQWGPLPSHVAGAWEGGGGGGGGAAAGAGTRNGRGRQPSAWRLDACSRGSSRALSQELVNRPRTKSR